MVYQTTDVEVNLIEEHDNVLRKGDPILWLEVKLRDRKSPFYARKDYNPYNMWEFIEDTPRYIGNNIPIRIPAELRGQRFTKIDDVIKAVVSYVKNKKIKELKNTKLANGKVRLRKYREISKRIEECGIESLRKNVEIKTIKRLLEETTDPRTKRKWKNVLDEWNRIKGHGS